MQQQNSHIQSKLLFGENDRVNTFELAKGGGDKPKIIHKAIVQPASILIKPYHTKRKSCFGTLTHWRLYYVVYVSVIILDLKTS